MQESKSFNKPLYTAYELFIRLLNNNLIKEYFHDKKFYHKSTKEEYIISKIEKALDSFDPIISIKNLKNNKLERIKLKELDNLIEIIPEDKSPTTFE